MQDLTASCCGSGGRDAAVFRFMRETYGWLDGIEGDERDRIESLMLIVAKSLGLLATPHSGGMDRAKRAARVINPSIEVTKLAEGGESTVNENCKDEHDTRRARATLEAAFDRSPRYSPL